MAADQTNLLKSLAAEPWRYDFFHAVRLLENHFRQMPRVGWSLRPAEDPVRFAQRPSLAFPSATIEAFEPAGGPPADPSAGSPAGPAAATDELPGAGPPTGPETRPGAPPRLYVQHFGLFGPNGALPLVWTEYAFTRQKHHGDRTFAAFVNVFQHRMYSFFYRAWASSQKTVDLDRTRGAGQGGASAAADRPAPHPGDEEKFAVFVGSLFGIGLESLRAVDRVPDHAKLYYSGRLAAPQRNAEGLEAILSDYFGLPCQVQQFAGVWLNLPPGCECRLGDSPATGRLGVNTIVGERVWDCQLNFRIRFGPTRLADFERLLPGSRSFVRLRDWVRNYCGEHYSWELQLVLARQEVPELQLGGGARLGWTTWLKTKPFERDAEDLVFCPAHIEAA